MGDTKERILLTALRLFARDGYEAVSVSNIAGELGMTKGALYRHYANKRDIFDSILARMEQRDAQQAQEHGVPGGVPEEIGEVYRNTPIDSVVEFAEAMFRYWTQDEFAVQFRRMLTLEQFRDQEMAALYQQYLVSGPLGYMTDLFVGLGLPRPQEEAAHFYAPMFLLYSVYDGGEDPAAVPPLMDQMLEKERKYLNELLTRKGEIK